MILLVLAAAALAAAAILVAASFRPRGILAMLLATLILGQAMLVSSVGLAGLLLRSLAPATLTAVAVGWLLAGALLAWRGGLMARGLAARGVGARDGARDRAPASAGGVSLAPRISAVLRDPAVALAAVLIVATFAWRVLLAARLPMVDYDGWSYHLVFGDVWLQANAIVGVPQRIWTAGYPANTELISTWLMAFTSSDALAGFTSVIPLPLAVVAAASLARSIGASARRSAVAGLLFGMTPALVAQAGTSYVDGSSVALVTASWALGLRILRGERDAGSWLLFGLAAGLAFGTKGTNVTLVGPIVVGAGLALLLGWRAKPDDRRPTPIARAVVALGLPILVFGASWYLKNILAYGNPLYPFAVGPFAGPTTLTAFTFTPPQLEHMSLPHQLLTSWLTDWHLGRYVYNVRPGGLGRAWPFLMIAAAVGLALMVRRRRFVAVIFVVVPVALTVATMPMPWYARLTLFLPALAVALGAVAIDRLPQRVATVASLGLVAVAGLSLAFANIRPNIDVRATTSTTTIAGPRAYVRYVLADDRVRADVSLRHECAGFAAIPAGARVAPAGFNLLHGVVGPNLDRILTAPLAGVADASSLVREMQALGATWLAASAGGAIDRIAAGSASQFRSLGDICQGSRLYELVGGS